MRNLSMTFIVLVLYAAGCESGDNFSMGGQDVPVPAGQVKKWSFDADSQGTLPADFINVLGAWQVAADPTAPSAANVLRQSGSFNNSDFPRVLVRDLSFGDLKLKVRCRPESGSADQACGLVFRAQDSDNYFITRANALEASVNLYRVLQRERQFITGASANVTAGTWQALEVVAQGSAITVSWNGAQLISATDATYARGKIGLWTKADSVTAFDELEATAQ
ncbi:MAG: hypothetical protein E6Q99_07725 [Elusimicrobia bacterium]|nr:MAG: hypothetical protein E6Q99_07725 [Elusimicrobiota bacterium]